MRPLRRALLVCAALPGLLFAAARAEASSIGYTVTSLGANQWRYDYTVANDLAAPVSEFSVFFDQALYANLQARSTVPGWDLLTVQPDMAIPASGFYDGLASAGGVADGASAGGFSVSFDYLGTGTPASQPFTFVDPASFAVLASGQTVLSQVPQVAEPGAWLLLLAGTVPILCLYRRQDGARVRSSLRGLP